jgi:hypothetical protein
MEAARRNQGQRWGWTDSKGGGEGAGKKTGQGNCSNPQRKIRKIIFWLRSLLL